MTELHVAPTRDAQRARALEEVLVRAGLPESVHARLVDDRGEHLRYGGESTSEAITLPDNGLFDDRQAWLGETRRALQMLREASDDLALDAALFADNRCAIDLPAVVYGLLARWEEELSDARDEHGRWQLASSVLAEGDLIDRPVVDELCRALGRRLAAKLGIDANEPVTPWGDKAWAFALTFDVDAEAMYLRGKALHTLRRLARERGWRATLPFVKEAAKVLSGFQADPYENFPWLADRLRELQVHATFFVPTIKSSKLDPFDLRRGSRLRRDLERLPRAGHEVGLHSSYNTATGPITVRMQRKSLCLRGAAHGMHRHHYLRSTHPRDWETLARSGIRVDASMMFSEREGFRLGTAFPVSIAVAKPDGKHRVLTVVPSHAMDVTLRYHRGMNPAQAMDAVRAQMERVRAVGGMAVLVWHPHNLEPRFWEGWSDVPFELLREARDAGAAVGTLGELLKQHAPYRRRFRLGSGAI